MSQSLPVGPPVGGHPPPLAAQEPLLLRSRELLAGAGVLAWEAGESQGLTPRVAVGCQLRAPLRSMHFPWHGAAILHCSSGARPSPLACAEETRQPVSEGLGACRSRGCTHGTSRGLLPLLPGPHGAAQLTTTRRTSSGTLRRCGQSA